MCAAGCLVGDLPLEWGEVLLPNNQPPYLCGFVQWQRERRAPSLIDSHYFVANLALMTLRTLLLCVICAFSLLPGRPRDG